MLAALRKRPWLLVVLAFVLLIGAWAALVVFAHHHQPVEIPVPKS